MTSVALLAGGRGSRMQGARRVLEPLDSSGAKTWQLGATQIAVGECSPLPATRTSDQIQSDGRDEYALVMSVQGEWTARFGIRKNRVLPKQAVMLDLGCGWAIDWSRGRQIAIVMPRMAIRALCPGAPRLHGSVLRTPSGGMLADHILSLVEELPALAVEEAATVEQALIAFVAGAINGAARNDAGRRAPLIDTSLVAARVRRHIEERLTDPQLSADSLCERLGLSKARLFQAFGSPGRVNDHIRSRRLAAAREIIVESVVAPDPADLARMFCFRDGAEFERAFVRYIGCPPAQARGIAVAR